jgi:hypothetical protein
MSAEAAGVLNFEHDNVIDRPAHAGGVDGEPEPLLVAVLFEVIEVDSGPRDRAGAQMYPANAVGDRLAGKDVSSRGEADHAGVGQPDERYRIGELWYRRCAW